MAATSPESSGEVNRNREGFSEIYFNQAKSKSYNNSAPGYENTRLKIVSTCLV
jgi:hypothetical protein